MDDFERKIAQALQADDAAEFEKLAPDAPPWEMMLETFKGRNRWLSLFAGIWMFVFFVAGIACIVQFFGAEEVRAMLTWGFAGLLLMVMMAFLKMWWLMEMQKNAVIREVKRVELQLAAMSRRNAEQQGG